MPRDRAARILLHANGVPESAVLTAEVAVLAGWMIFAVCAGTAAAAAGAGIVLNLLDAPLDLLSWSVSSVAWGLLAIAGIAAVNSLQRSAAVNAALLGAAWLIVVKIVPGTIDLFAKTAFPLPTGAAMIDDNRSATEEAMKAGDRMLSNWLGDHPELKGSGKETSTEDFYAMRVLVDRAVAEELDDVRVAAESALNSRARLVAFMSFLSPLTVAENALTSAAGTSRERFEELRKQVGAAHGEWRSFFEPMILERRPIATLDIVPRPRFVEPSTATKLVALARSTAVQLVLAAVLLLSARRIRRTALSGD